MYSLKTMWYEFHIMCFDTQTLLTLKVNPEGLGMYSVKINIQIMNLSLAPGKL